MPIEVELRCFLEKEEHAKLVDFFNKVGSEHKQISQITTYYKGEHSFRTVTGTNGAKIVLKVGDLHGEQREELEVPFAKESTATIERMLALLGYVIECKWFRKRQYWNYKDIAVCLDDTKGYGYVLELDRVTSEESKDIALKALQELMKELNIKVTPKEVFDKKYVNYIKQWKELTKEQ